MLRNTSPEYVDELSKDLLKWYSASNRGVLRYEMPTTGSNPQTSCLPARVCVCVVSIPGISLAAAVTFKAAPRLACVHTVQVTLFVHDFRADQTPMEGTRD